ncbi:MAG TPA: hypothetical protein PLM33_13385 [Acidobacteriota bacterium]|mgnify:FL=1|nr:hypothetical protein [Acidobacteriota bacterium]HPC44302.1 hypothetical protein [Candidatus Latescibacterota bacterium]HQI77321.1 hypothetical protein [Candidatus Latescibacterota bacterium]HRS95263.1 hypothetical protein [Candidatus Latescibacterota bacterium]HRU23519.1 hypothetical protein [Candidatus Latescibacterota bacterium]
MSPRAIVALAVLGFSFLAPSFVSAATRSGGWDKSVYFGPFAVGYATTKPFSGGGTPQLRWGWKVEGGWTGGGFGGASTYNDALIVSPQGLIRLAIPLEGTMVLYPQLGLGVAARFDDGSGTHSGAWVGPIGSFGIGLQFGKWGALIQGPGLPGIGVTYHFQ